jgi:hypothetical protein
MEACRAAAGQRYHECTDQQPSRWRHRRRRSGRKRRPSVTPAAVARAAGGVGLVLTWRVWPAAAHLSPPRVQRHARVPARTGCAGWGFGSTAPPVGVWFGSGFNRRKRFVSGCTVGARDCCTTRWGPGRSIQFPLGSSGDGARASVMQPYHSSTAPVPC